MASIGTFGDLLFEVSDETVLTVRDMSYNMSMRWAKHQRHNWSDRVEFIAPDAETITLNIPVGFPVGVDPEDVLIPLRKMARAGEHHVLTLGNKVYGDYHWSITNIAYTPEYHSSEGDVIHANISLSLIEYRRK